MIRKAAPEDLEQILAVFAAAKALMVKTGNAAQWEPGYPDSVIPGDIAAGNCYVEENNGTVHGVMHATVEGDIDLNLISGSANEEQDDDED